MPNKIITLHHCSSVEFLSVSALSVSALTSYCYYPVRKVCICEWDKRNAECSSFVGLLRRTVCEPGSQHQLLLLGVVMLCIADGPGDLPTCSRHSLCSNNIFCTCEQHALFNSTASSCYDAAMLLKVP